MLLNVILTIHVMLAIAIVVLVLVQHGPFLCHEP